MAALLFSRILYSPQVLLDLWFLFLSVDRFLMLYTTYLTLVYALHGGWFKSICLVISPKMSPTGPEAVCTVSGVRFSNMFTQLFLIFLFLLDGSVTFTLT